ncbi:multiple epidermal growth factor-like domains 10, partial [Elysia marginata]
TQCGPFWTVFTPARTCVKVYDQHTHKLTWNDARAVCKDNEGDLVKILTPEEDAFIWGLVNSTHDAFWIGLAFHDNAHFRWQSDITAPSFLNWDSSQPGAGFCAKMNSYPDRSDWASEDCSIKTKFICEKFADCLYEPEGMICEKQCSAQCGRHGEGQDDTCERRTGRCFLGCTPGYAGHSCNTVCPNDTYGAGCKEKCSPNCAGVNKTCSNINGTCDHGCTTGFEGAKCNQSCANSMWGPNCRERCSMHCAGPHHRCNSVDGTCDLGCTPGFTGPKCDTVCPQLSFGLNCSQTCSPTCAGALNECANVDGACLLGCEPGYEGAQCLITLDMGSILGDYLVILTTSLAALAVLGALVFGVVLSHKKDQMRWALTIALVAVVAVVVIVVVVVVVVVAAAVVVVVVVVVVQ